MANSDTLLEPSKARGRKPVLPAFRPPQLATLVDAVPQGSGWLFETKYDGYRCLAAIAGTEVRLYTRHGHDWTDKFASLREPLGRLTTGSALIDGEVCALDENGRTSFSALKDALSAGGPLVYFAFDLLEQDGEDLTRLPLIERKARLQKLLQKLGKDSPIRFSEHTIGNGEAVFNAACAAGLEGVIAKEVGVPYRSERTKAWLKIKCLQRQEFVIGGWRPSQKRSRFASLLLGTWENGKLIYRGRVGTGFSEKDAAALQAELDKRARSTLPFASVPRPIANHANWVEPELVGEVAFTEFTPDGFLRHPSFIGLREDKPAKSVKLEKPAAPPPDQPAKPAAPAHLSVEAGIAAAEREGVRVTSPDRLAYPGQGVTKGELIAYYNAVAERMLPHLEDRPLSLVRCPQGRAKYCFFQKHDTGGFPTAMKTVAITEKDGRVENYFYVDSLAGIIAAVQMNVLEFHLWGSRRDDIERPERVIFDIDPDEGMAFEHVRSAAMDISRGLEEFGFTTFPLLTGGKGIHVIAPVQPLAEWPDVKRFCKAFAQRMATAEPDRFTSVLSKAKRKGKLFIDYLRNERGSTAIAPWSTRSREGAPVATPITWDELPNISAANAFSLVAAAERARGPDPWAGYFAVAKPITPTMIEKLGG
jgi:bifunctional non-homologous end joining protein LigD